MNLTQQVESLLRHLPQTRNSDKELFVCFMQKYGLELSPKQIAKFKQMPSLETVRRTRQKIQEQGKFEASEAVNEDRYKKFQSVRNNIKSVEPEKLLETQGYKIREWGDN